MEQTVDGISSEVYKAIVPILDDRMRNTKVTRQDFDELKGVVRDLAEAQSRWEILVSGYPPKRTKGDYSNGK